VKLCIDFLHFDAQVYKVNPLTCFFFSGAAGAAESRGRERTAGAETTESRGRVL